MMTELARINASLYGQVQFLLGNITSQVTALKWEIISFPGRAITNSLVATKVSPTPARPGVLSSAMTSPRPSRRRRHPRPI
jgi:hypothetical protein